MIRYCRLNLKLWSIVICQLFLILACDPDKKEWPNDDQEPITFPAGFINNDWVRDDHSATCESRVSDMDWSVNDSVGIYMIPNEIIDLTNSEVWENKKHIIDSLNHLNPDGEANALYYPINGSEVHFMAYYPYTSKATSDHKVIFSFADQSDKASKESKDFCFHRGTESYAFGTPALDLRHKFCKILMNISRGTGGPSCAGITASLSNMPASATIDLAKMTADAAGENNITNLGISTTACTISACTSSSTDSAATIEAIIAPHSGKGKFIDREFTFTTADGDEKVYILPDSITFSSGKVYTFTLEMINDTTISVQPPTKVADGMTNCYITGPDTSLRFPVSRAYTFNGSAFTNFLHVDNTAEYTGGFIAAVLWDDNKVISGTPKVSGLGNSAIVMVQTAAGASKSGNAVIKICKKGETTPVWSYHIWVTDYDPNTGNTFTHTGNTNNNGSNFVFMDRNLGATFAGLGSGFGSGLFYQWGRKDPFPSTGPVTKVSTTSAIGTVVHTIKSPNIFYTAGSSSGNDWHYNLRKNDLWGHAIDGGQKTIYDPCPAGWRVPVNSDMSEKKSPWYGFKYSNGGYFSKGYNWGTHALYPATGYRGYNDGSLYTVGGRGQNWSASPYKSNNSNAMILSFYTGDVSVYYGSERAYGHMVRCVKE
ncbi:MAG: fimbrillin family protein [Mediterranea sp.]|jgi:hypothetical protein|nr:fimbrillin family protein [Mediterranea sp.]